MLFPILGPGNVPVLVAQSEERHANRTVSVLEWYEWQTQSIQHLVLFLFIFVLLFDLSQIRYYLTKKRKYCKTRTLNHVLNTF